MAAPFAASYGLRVPPCLLRWHARCDAGFAAMILHADVAAPLPCRVFHAATRLCAIDMRAECDYADAYVTTRAFADAAVSLRCDAKLLLPRAP